MQYKTLAAALVTIAAVTFGCGKSESYKVKEGEVKVNRKEGQVTFEGNTKDGKVTVTAGKEGVPLPDGFPKDVPIYKGAVVQVASSEGKTMLVHLNVSAPVADALKYYQDQLKEQGWEIKSTMNMGEGSMLTAQKGERQCTAVAMKQDKGTLVQLSVTQQGS
jgi:hypothetical protein